MTKLSNLGTKVAFFFSFCLPGLRIKETKEVYEGEVTELTPAETENPMGGMYRNIRML